MGSNSSLKNNNMINFQITRFEENGGSLFICVYDPITAVSIEHFFTDEEKKNLKDAIEKLIAELEIKAESYVPPIPIIDRKEEMQNFKVDAKNVKKYKDELKKINL